MYSAAVLLILITAENVFSGAAPRFNSSLLDSQLPEDVVSDLAGRRRLVTVDPQTGNRFANWIITDLSSQLPIVLDPRSGLPYLLEYSDVMINDESAPMRLWRLFRGPRGPVLLDPKAPALLRPSMGRYNNVLVTRITEEAAGFTIGEALAM